ncbi:class I SAM-dependent methyltransferase [Nannocystis pusilla]|uniref:Class I SAM-dependent methyltransferase n=1 Tax=Nannocystis pusilla TaxID=889268 RepID=A0ABS7TKG2_9BACT|nr:class I SAM-dependent methyltransferase [Nannocystis pusilla]
MLVLPRLTTTPPAACAICGEPGPRLLGSRDFGDSCNDAFAGSRTFPHYGIAIPYHRCPVCAFTLTTAFDAWTAGDYREFIYNNDYTRADPPFVIERPLRNAQILAGIWHYEKGVLRVLDYGAGDGAFAAELARLGIDCDSCDLFYGEPPEPRRYQVVTCFEVIEHIPHRDQIAFFDGLVSHVEPGGLLVMSTVLLAPDAPVDDNYIGPRNGHVSIHSDASLRRLAARHDLSLLSLNNQFHVLRRPPAAGEARDAAALRALTETS